MKMIDKTTIEVFVICNKVEYSKIRDQLLPKLCYNTHIPFVINGVIFLEDKEIIPISPNTGFVFCFTESKKVPLSINRHLVTVIEKKVTPIVYFSRENVGSDFTDTDISGLKQSLYETVPTLVVFSDTTKLLKKENYLSPYTFNLFRKDFIENPSLIYETYPYFDDDMDKQQSKEIKARVSTTIENFMKEKLSKGYAITGLSLIQIMKDMLSCVVEKVDVDFSLFFTENWFEGYIKQFPNKNFSFYENAYRSFFHTEMSENLYAYLKQHSLVLKEIVPIEQTSNSICLDGLEIDLVEGVSLTLKEIKSSSLKTNTIVVIDSIDKDRIFNLTTTPCGPLEKGDLK